MSPAPAIDPAARLARHPSAAFRELGDGRAVLLQLESGGYHGVNAVGVAVWQAVGDGATFGDVLAAVRARFPDAPDAVEGDVASFVSDLETRELLTVTPPG